MMTTESPASPARAGADDDESDTPPETPQQALSALCADIDFNDDLPQATNLGHGILTLLQLPALRALPKTPLEETILGLKVEVERLVEELDSALQVGAEDLLVRGAPLDCLLSPFYILRCSLHLRWRR